MKKIFIFVLLALHVEAKPQVEEDAVVVQAPQIKEVSKKVLNFSLNP